MAYVSIMLTKKALMSFETGHIISSNLATVSGDSRYVADVAAPEIREDQWRGIRRAKVNGRLCHVFSTRAEYAKQLGVWAKQAREATERRG